MANYTDDEYMEYDLAKHRYVLTEKAVLDDKGIDMQSMFDNPEVDIPAFLKRVSLEVYTGLLAGVRNKDESQYVLSQNRFRDVILEGMEEQAFALLTDRTDPAAFFANTEKVHELSPMAARILQEGGAMFRGKWSLKYVPNGFMDTKGVDW